MVYHPNARQVRYAALLYMAQGTEGAAPLMQQGFCTADMVRALLYRVFFDRAGQGSVSLCTVERHMRAQFTEHPEPRYAGYFNVSGSPHAS